jgi:hypothetical protein
MIAKIWVHTRPKQCGRHAGIKRKLFEQVDRLHSDFGIVWQIWSNAIICPNSSHLSRMIQAAAGGHGAGLCGVGPAGRGFARATL